MDRFPKCMNADVYSDKEGVWRRLTYTYFNSVFYSINSWSIETHHINFAYHLNILVATHMNHQGKYN